MEERLLQMLHCAINMLIDEDVMFVDIMEGLNTNEEELIKLGFENLVC